MKEKKLLILGGRGLVGSALVREFKEAGYQSILSPNREELDLTNQSLVEEYFQTQKPQIVIDAAAKVGGIHANNEYRGDFILQNLLIQNNLFKAALESKTEKFLFLGSSCIYPKECPQPMKEEHLLTSPLEQTNEPYAIAKIAGLKTAESLRRQYGVNFFSAMPTNLYGENDNFHPENSHVIPALIQRMDKTIKNNEQEFVVWGTGKPMREFLYVDDLAKACRFLVEFDGELPDWINVGTGVDVTIRELAETIADVMGFKGNLVFDTSKPDGTARKLLDIEKIKKLGWSPKVSLKEGIEKTVDYYQKNSNIRSY